MKVKSCLSSLSLVMGFLAICLSACGVSTPKGFKPSPDWGRGIRIGQSVVGSIGMAVEEDGEPIHLVFPSNATGDVQVRYVRLDSRAQPVEETTPQTSTGQLRAPRLALAGEDRLHLFWVTRPSSLEPWSVWHTLLSTNGRGQSDPKRLSTPDSSVGDYAIAPDDSGGVVVVWEADSRGIYAVRMDSQGEMVSTPEVLSDVGEAPAVRVDKQGDLHLAWMEGTEIMYARSSPDELGITQGTPVAQVRLGTGDALNGPIVGLSDRWVYVFWAVLSRSGLAAGGAQTFYVAFPPGMPQETSSPEPLWVLPIEDLPYGDTRDDFKLTRLAPPTTAIFTSDFVYQPNTLQGQQEDLAVAFTVTQQYRQAAYVQVAMGVFEAGQFKGYEFASKTTSLSTEPLLVVDNNRDLHLAWRDGAAGQNLYYSTTAPEARAVLDRLDFNDIANVVLEGGIEGLAGVTLFPLAIPWLVPGLVLLGAWKLIRDQESLSDPISLLLLILGIGLYQFTKVIFLPTMLSYVPFSAWVDIPNGWQTFLRVGVPLVILVIALLVAIFVQRRRSSSTLLFYFIVALVDMGLTLMIYGVNFMGVF